MMVAMALIVFIMAILSQAFVAATTSFRDLKAAADMAERLRSVTTLLRRELAADHFEGKKRLSSPQFWNDGPPREGFFRIYQGGPSVDEGADADGLHSYSAINHVLHFAIKVRGNQRSDFLSASVPAGSPLLTAFGSPDARYQDPNSPTYNYQWAEVLYFLRPAVDSTGTQDNANGTPLYTLFRRQYLAVPDNSLVNPPVPVTPAGQPNPYLEVSCKPDPNPANSPNLYFNSSISLTMPARRMGMDPNNPAGVPPAGVTPPLSSPLNWPATMGEDNVNYQTADVLVTDVISFNVRVLVDGGSDFVDLFDPTIQAAPLGLPWSNKNPAYPPNTAPQVFDTWSSAKDDVYDYSNWSQPGQAGNNTTLTSIPFWQNNKGLTIKAVQISLRVWELKTEQTRQVTIVQQM
jgi:hypothetical protein